MMEPRKHIYRDDDGAKFLRGEPAVAICGFIAEGKGTPSDERCENCRKMAGLSMEVESW